MKNLCSAPWGGLSTLLFLSTALRTALLTAKVGAEARVKEEETAIALIGRHAHVPPAPNQALSADVTCAVRSRLVECYRQVFCALCITYFVWNSVYVKLLLALSCYIFDHKMLKYFQSSPFVCTEGIQRNTNNRAHSLRCIWLLYLEGARMRGLLRVLENTAYG